FVRSVVERTMAMPRETAYSPCSRAVLVKKLLRTCLGRGPALSLLAADGPAVLRGRGQRAEAAEHPRGLLPRRSRLCGPPADEGEHDRRAIRQAPGEVAREAPRHREVHPLSGQCAVLQQAVREAMVGEPPGVSPGAAAGLLAEP